MEAITKAELARRVGVNRSMIAKYVKSGLLDECYTDDGKKVFYELAKEVIDKSRQKPKSKHRKKDIEKQQKQEEFIQRQKEYAEYNPHIKDQDPEDLVLLLLDSQSPSQTVQIKKDYWIGRTNRQKFLQAEGDLLTVEDAKAILEKVATPINQAMDDLPTDLKARFIDVDDDAIEWLSERINEIKLRFQSI